MNIKNIVEISSKLLLVGAFSIGNLLSVSPVSAALQNNMTTQTNPQVLDKNTNAETNFRIFKKEPKSEPLIILAMGIGNTSSITGTINRGRNQCQSVPAEYQADCLSQTFKSASRVSNGMPDYVTAGKELRSANKQIDALVSQNLDKNAPIIRKGGRKLRAVKKSAIAKVNSKTKAIVSNTASKLIRAAGNSQKRKVHFSKIAKAIDSTKVILRSA